MVRSDEVGRKRGRLLDQRRCKEIGTQCDTEKQKSGDDRRGETWPLRSAPNPDEGKGMEEG